MLYAENKTVPDLALVFPIITETRTKDVVRSALPMQNVHQTKRAYKINVKTRVPELADLTRYATLVITFQHAGVSKDTPGMLRNTAILYR